MSDEAKIDPAIEFSANAVEGFAGRRVVMEASALVVLHEAAAIVPPLKKIGTFVLEGFAGCNPFSSTRYHRHD